MLARMETVDGPVGVALHDLRIELAHERRRRRRVRRKGHERHSGVRAGRRHGKMPSWA